MAVQWSTVHCLAALRIDAHVTKRIGSENTVTMSRWDGGLPLRLMVVCECASAAARLLDTGEALVPLVRIKGEGCKQMNVQ